MDSEDVGVLSGGFCVHLMEIFGNIVEFHGNPKEFMDSENVGVLWSGFCVRRGRFFWSSEAMFGQ